MLGNINSTLIRFNDLINVNGNVTLISLEFTGMYQVYRILNTVLRTNQYIFRFSNLTLINESAYVYCYTVPNKSSTPLPH
ncbi:hypothetical protein [Caldivirga sp. UBA161]|uniref:hypothetical protein n=1 Tax=Caldivirga sp. UBA161 TaxID=1915569 RepID=UPI0025C5DD21|nr:hypothetical protein [Caldivirga sp. UBA161]